MNNRSPTPRIRTAGALASAALWVVIAADATAQHGAAGDRRVLEVLYRATGGDDWTDSTNWLTEAPLGDWYGVEVDEDGRVTKLRLGDWDESAQKNVGNGLTGSLPAELGSLSRLRWLEFAGNSGLTGPVPSALGELTDLRILALPDNWLTGSIPAQLGNLGNLGGFWLDGNALTGPIPAELGKLTNLGSLTLGNNVLTGPIPPELGNLTSLAELRFDYTMLSGPLPERLTRLSALDRLDLDGSGLCVPATPDVRAWLATISDFTGVFCDGRVTFSRVVSQPGLGRLDFVVAVIDLDGDGRDDILAGGIQEHNVSTTPEDRLTKTTLRVFVGEEDGSFRYAPELIEGTIEARTPIAVADDFNGDGRVDLAVYDYGLYVHEHNAGYGNPPQLFLSGPDGRLRPSDALADAVRREHEQRPNPDYSGPADMHLKSATSGDIDGDDDVDLWVQSGGGANVEEHFVVNNGDGTFTVDRDNRATKPVLHNQPPDGSEYWGYVGSHFVDVDKDGDLDLALGYARELEGTAANSHSVVMVNDGTGYYPDRIDLPYPAFNDGYTAVDWLTHFDVNADGFQDLLLMHQRNNDALPNVLPFTGRYLQVLINRDGRSFDDETPTWMGDQSATTPERSADGEPLNNVAQPRLHDVDRDGCVDLVMARSPPVRAESPLVYRNDGSGRFRAMSPMPFVGSSRSFGILAMPADVNGDAVVDFVVPHYNRGPDRRYGTADDLTTLVTLLNTTPAGPVRCADPTNRAPVPAGTLPDRTLVPAATLNVDVSQAFVDPDGERLTYSASSSAPSVVAVRTSGARVTLTAATAGVAAIHVTATDPGGLTATQQFAVTVTAAGAFTDDPIRPGETPIKAIHFTELRTRIDILREVAGLDRFSWTDRLLTPGVTPVRLAHLLELREALGAAYRAAGRSAPPWTDAAPAATSTPIRALHLMELRAAVLALE